MADLSWHQNRVRGGARGGQDQFKWDQVKDMAFKDRECYLGASTQVLVWRFFWFAAKIENCHTVTHSVVFH